MLRLESEGKEEQMSQRIDHQAEEIRSPGLFVLFRPSTAWMKPTYIREGSLLSPPIQMVISSTNTLTDHQNNV